MAEETWSPLQLRLLRAAQDVVSNSSREYAGRDSGDYEVDPEDFEELKEVVDKVSDEAAKIIRDGVKASAK